MFRTIQILIDKKPDILFVQNPSLILATFSGLLKIIFRYKLVVDRHTNFLIGKKIDFNPKFFIFRILSRFSLSITDLTIVTNSFLVDFVNKKGGKGFELTDKIPNLICEKKIKLHGKKNFVFICTFAGDEPYLNVFKAAKKLPHDVFIYVTGNYLKVKNEIDKLNLSENVILTGFLKEQDYVDLLHNCDAIIDLTTLEYCLVCGGYESMATGKPLLTSKKMTLMNFYNKGAYFCNSNSDDIFDNIQNMIPNLKELTKDIIELKKEKEVFWLSNFQVLKNKIVNL